MPGAEKSSEGSSPWWRSGRLLGSAVLGVLVALACTQTENTDPGPDRRQVCARDGECDSGICDRVDDGDDIPPADDPDGLCYVFADECDEARVCSGDLVCSDFFCERRCEAPGERGERCFLTTDTPSCEPMTKPCGTGLVCDVEETGFGNSGTCVPPTGRALDEVCHGDVCDEGLRCDDVAQVCVSSP